MAPIGDDGPWGPCLQRATRSTGSGTRSSVLRDSGLPKPESRLAREVSELARRVEALELGPGAPAGGGRSGGGPGGGGSAGFPEPRPAEVPLPGTGPGAEAPARRRGGEALAGVGRELAATRCEVGDLSRLVGHLGHDLGMLALQLDQLKGGLSAGERGGGVPQISEFTCCEGICTATHRSLQIGMEELEARMDQLELLVKRRASRTAEEAPVLLQPDLVFAQLKRTLSDQAFPRRCRNSSNEATPLRSPCSREALSSSCHSTPPRPSPPRCSSVLSLEPPLLQRLPQGPRRAVAAALMQP